MTAVEEEVAVGVDIDAIVSCDVVDPKTDERCQREAEWLGTTRCCHLSAVECTPHKEEAVRYCEEIIAAYRGHRAQPVCEACGAPFVHALWTPL